MCVFRASSRHVPLDMFLVTSKLDVYRHDIKGDAPTVGKERLPFTEHCIHVDVSKAGMGALDQQIADAEAFLKTFRDELAQLKEDIPDCDLVLDFPCERRGAMQCERFPAPFLKQAGEAGVDVELSLYPAGNPLAEGGGSDSV